MKYLMLIIFVLLTRGTHSSHLFDLNPNNTDDFIDLYRMFYDLRQYILEDTESYEVNDSVNWSTIYVVGLENGQTNGFLQLELQKAVASGRLPMDFQSLNIDADVLTMEDIDYLSDSLSLNILNGMKFTAPAEPNTTRFIKGVFNSIVFDFHESDFNPRTICIIAEDFNMHNTTGCVSIEYIGMNEEPVILTYTPIGNVFLEESGPIQVLNGNLTVEHDDHPSFQLQEMKVKVLHVDRDYETLALDITDLDYIYDELEGELTLTVEGSPENYTEYMKSVVYSNLNPEPITENKTIIFTVTDGFQPDELVVYLSVVNKNDEPVFTFSDTRLVEYIEGNGSVIIDNALSITDADTDSSIKSVIVQLLDEDLGFEYLFIDYNSNLFIIDQINGTTISVTGNGSLTQYAAILQSLSYLHTDSNPGNPTMGERIIEFNVYDGLDTFLMVFEFEIVSVNDPPILLIADDTKKNLNYTEDDSALYFATDVYLQDVDSNISSVIIAFSGLLNGDNDMFLLNNELLDIYDVEFSETNTTLILYGNASAEIYEKILQSFYYINDLQDNTIANGLRVISIAATDTSEAQSETVSIYIDVQNRNDPPEISINDMLQFTEGSPSIAIATSYILSLMDEEQNNISKINVTLVSVNGKLDTGDSFAFRSIQTTLLNTVEVFPTYISTSDPGTVEEYEDFLRSIRYINEEVEPTYYVNSTSNELLMREIIIEITDNAPSPSTAVYAISINITLINDEKPAIRIHLTDSSCYATYPMGQPSKYSKRDTYSFNRLHKRLHNKRRSNIAGLAPTVAANFAQLSPNKTSCISNITVEFSTDTNAPPVEFKRDLLEVISLLPATLNSHLKHGQWINHKTIVIYLTECYEDNIGSGLKVVFEPTKGGDSECNATSKCTDGICFRNSTGCPVAGFSSILTNFSPTSDTPSQSPHTFSSNFSLTPYIGIVLTAIVIIILFICGARFAISRSDTTKNKDTSTLYEFDGIKCSTIKEVQTLIPQHDKTLTEESDDDQKAVISDEVLEQLKKTTQDVNVAENETISSSHSDHQRQKRNDCTLQIPLAVVLPDNDSNADSSLRRVQQDTNDSQSNGQVRTLIQLDSKDR